MRKGNPISNLLFAAVAAVIIVWFYPHPEANHYKFEEGRPWNYAKLIAPFDIPIYPDSGTVLQVRDSLNRHFVPVFEYVPSMGDSVITSLMAKWVRADDNGGTSGSDARLRKRLVAYLKTAYSGKIIDNEYGERIAAGTLDNVRISRNNTVHQLSTHGFSTPESLLEHINSTFDNPEDRESLKSYDLPSLLRPNMIYNARTSKQLYDHEIYRFTAIKGVIQQGQTIIDKGAVITPQDYTNLLTYERMVDEQLTADHQSLWFVWLGQALYVGILMSVLLLYLRFNSPEIWGRRRAMIFVMSLIVVAFLLATGLDHFIEGGIYLVPFTVVPVLLVVFFNAPTALTVSSVLILLCGGVATFPLEFIFLQTAAATAAVFSLKELSKRAQLLRTSIFVAVTYWCGYVAMETMMNGSFDGFSWRMIVYLTVSSLLASTAYILMAAVEKLFGFVSVVTLIELSDINNPLLRELSEECPGTFQHAMAVSNLAADAAMRIGANVQLVRAGALYHDIGKLENPNFFTENQHGVNPHDALDPEQSARIIVQHVADGLRRAEKAGLPKEIRDFIAEHHGSGRAKYFYFTWCKAHPDATPDESLFTYPGPNPRTRETSVMMMADAVEAASRSLKEHTPEAIRELVNKIIDGQIADGLHNDSPLSFRDVQIIKEAFIKRLMTIYHSRIVYPDAPKSQEKQ